MCVYHIQGMPSFNFVVVDENGNQKTGRIEATSKQAAFTKLRSDNLNPLSLEPVKEAKNVEDILDRFRDVSADTLVYFTRQLATMIDSGLSPLRALATLEEQETNPKFKTILSQVIADVESGIPLHEAFSKHPIVFENIYIAMVKSGEESGNLHGALKELSNQLEKAAKLKKAIKSAMIYPKVVLGFAFIIISGLLMTIVPKFGKIFQETVASTYDPESGEPPPSSDLPGLTQATLDVSHMLYPDKPKSLLWVGEVALRFFLLFAIIWIIRRIIKNILRKPGPREKWDAFKLRAPMRIGPLVQKIVVARFSRTFASLLKAGVPAVEALDIVADTAGNVVVSNAVQKAREQMLAGASIYEPLQRSGAFPITVTRMIQIGEETGKLELMLVKVAEFFEEEVDLQIQGLTSIIEPLMIIVVGAAVGLIILSIYLPMFSIYDKIGFVFAPFLKKTLLVRSKKETFENRLQGFFDKNYEQIYS